MCHIAKEGLLRLKLFELAAKFWTCSITFLGSYYNSQNVCIFAFFEIDAIFGYVVFQSHMPW